MRYGTDVSEVSQGILAIPAVASLAPFVWAYGATLYVEELDKTFFHSLAQIKQAMMQAYPGIDFRGSIRAGRLSENRYPAYSSAMLYTGGVDSLATYIRHREEKPLLISVGTIGPVSVNKLQRRIYDEILRFCAMEGAGLSWVESNITAFLSEAELSRDFGDHFVIKSWWWGIQHGLGLLGLSAPLAAARNIGHLYIAATFNHDFPHPCGSMPSIDGNVAWGSTTVSHDSYDLSRQMKIRRVIGPFIKDQGKEVRVIACNDVNRQDHLNCCECEKCFRTIAGLSLEGIDPNSSGFTVNEATFEKMRQMLTDEESTNETKTFLWTDIQRHIPERIEQDFYGSKAFFEWLKNYRLRNKHI